MLTMIHTNPARLEGGVFIVDRKFHTGMQKYVQNISTPILSIHPQGASDNPIMDPIAVPCEQLGYKILTVKAGASLKRVEGESVRLEDQIKRSKLIYGGDLTGIEIARTKAVPYILILEYDLRTQIVITATQVSNVLRRAARAARCASRYATEIPAMCRAYALHCNGYPVYDESKLFNRKRLLYFDSRISEDMLIPQAQLDERLFYHRGRALRLLYSGRYEPLKGAVDAVCVARECLKRGLNIEMHCYGRGSSRSEMRDIASDSICYGKVHVHDAIPYPELVEISRRFDVFVCCHIQSDPSCTYLESFGAGLPIVGYDNRMWLRLRQESRAGLSSPIGDPGNIAENIERLLSEDGTLVEMSKRARKFAAEHTFEIEFKRRIDHLNAALNTL
jgi:colanic acid/amylovoran biosynthesis glycosyltransferase